MSSSFQGLNLNDVGPSAAEKNEAPALPAPGGGT